MVQVLVFRISTPARDAGQNGRRPASLKRDPPAFDSSILRIFVLTVGAFSATGIDALETEPKAWREQLWRIAGGLETVPASPVAASGTQ